MSGEGCFPLRDCLLFAVSFRGGRGRHPSAVWALIPFSRALHSQPGHFPRAPPQHAIILGIRLSTDGFGGNSNQSSGKQVEYFFCYLILVLSGIPASEHSSREGLSGSNCGPSEVLRSTLQVFLLSTLTLVRSLIRQTLTHYRAGVRG